MTSKERILNTLERKPVDRAPADIWMTGEVFNKLADHFGTAEEKEIYRKLGVDKIYWLSAPYTEIKPSKENPDEDEIFNEWGACYKPKAYEDGEYLENSYYPLKAMETVEEVENYNWPDPDKFDFQALASSWLNHKDEATMLSFVSLFETYTSLRSFDEALMDLYINQDFLRAALKKLADIQIEYIKRSLTAAPGIDLVYYSDDMGMQDRQIIPTEVWSEFIEPHAARVIETVHSFGKKVFYHSDGSAFEIVEKLVNLGVDVINPIQYICPGMERDVLKEKLGDRVIFHGAVENQNVLPFGTAEDVKQEVNDCKKILGEGGGYIVAPCHNLQPNTPVENIIALYQAAADV
ncbi:MAG: uroporphyrinogen decarboxylase family protein [Spirochaetales bacterium]|nr:uroporphyrinogen decarboxylase family protein [Spirochaetales bacterium]